MVPGPERQVEAPGETQGQHLPPSPGRTPHCDHVRPQLFVPRATCTCADLRTHRLGRWAALDSSPRPVSGLPWALWGPGPDATLLGSPKPDRRGCCCFTRGSQSGAGGVPWGPSGGYGEDLASTLPWCSGLVSAPTGMTAGRGQGRLSGSGPLIKPTPSLLTLPDS